MKKVFFFLFIIISLIIIHNLVRSTYGLWQKRSLVLSAQKQLEQEKSEHALYEQQLAAVKTPSFVEEQARDKLFFTKPGETIVLVPSPSVTPAVSNQAPSTPHWQQWLAVFVNPHN